jgi:hypothetical protein
MSSQTGAERPCWTPDRCELREWLRQSDAAALAELYEGAVLLLFDSRIPGYTRFVAHAVREIRNRLPNAISGTRSRGLLDYKRRVDALVEAWKAEGFATDGSTPGQKMSEPIVQPHSLEITLPANLVLKIASLVAEHEEARERPFDSAVRLRGRESD